MSSQNGKQLGWKWFKFIIYFQLYASAFIQLVNAYRFFTGMIYGTTSGDAALIYAVFPGLQPLNIFMGILSLAVAASAFFVRQKLAHFDKQGPKLYIMRQIIIIGLIVIYTIATCAIIAQTAGVEASSELLGEMIGQSSGGMIFAIALAWDNKVYFNKRKEYFVEGGVSNPAQYLLDLSNGTAQTAQQMAGSQPQGNQPWQAQPQQLPGQQPWQGQLQGNQPQQPQGDQSQPQQMQGQSQPQQPWQVPQQPQPDAPQNAEQPQVQEHGVLIGLKGLYAGAEIPMNDGDEITFGRADTNNLIFATEPRISREHCKIRWDAKKEKYIFRDYSSSGSYINGSDDCLPQNLDLEVACGSEIALGNQDNVFLLK